MAKKQHESFEELEATAHNPKLIKPLSPEMRRQWEAAKRTGTRKGPGRPSKDPAAKSRIVPISLDPKLLKQIDKYAKLAGLSRSRLVAEGLKLRMNV